MTKPIILRHKTSPTADDPDWIGNATDPRDLRVTVASAEAGAPTITLTPEDTSISAVSVATTITTENETATATALAAAANTLAATQAGKNFLRPGESTSSGAVVVLALQPGAPLLVPTYTAPGSMTLTPDHAGKMPVIAKGDGEGSLDISVYAVSSTEAPLAPGSGTVTLELLGEVERTEPRPGLTDTEEPAWEVLGTAAAQALNTPWTVAKPNGRYTVRVTSDASLPGSTDALQVWANEKAEVLTVPDDGSVTAAKLGTAAVTGAALGGGSSTHPVDTNLVLNAEHANTVIGISTTIGGSGNTITRGTLPAGVMVFVEMTAFDTNAYTCAVQGGTVTFNAAQECGAFFWDGAALRFIPTGDVPATFA